MAGTNVTEARRRARNTPSRDRRLNLVHQQWNGRGRSQEIANEEVARTMTIDGIVADMDSKDRERRQGTIALRPANKRQTFNHLIPATKRGK